MQALGLALTAEQIAIITRIGLVINATRGALTAYKISSIKNFSILEDAGVSKGDFRIVYFHGEKEKRISEAEFLNMMRDQRITCVKRCCQSLTGWFPSGIISVFTWTLIAQTVRHEFALLHTKDYVILIEVTSDKPSSSTKGMITAIRVLKATTKEEKEAAEEIFCKNRYWTREMAVLKGKDVADLGMDQVLGIVIFWIVITRAGGEKYTIIQKNCKSLARTIRYFCEAEIDYANVLNSLWGIFTDKLGKVAIHLDVVIVEKLVLHGARAFKSVRDAREATIEKIKNLREGPYITYDNNA